MVKIDSILCYAQMMIIFVVTGHNTNPWTDKKGTANQHRSILFPGHISLVVLPRNVALMLTRE